MYCQKCGKVLDDEAIMCPGCGTPTLNARGRQTGKKKRSSEPSRPLSEEEIKALAEQEKAKTKRIVLIVCLVFLGLLVINWGSAIIAYMMK